MLRKLTAGISFVSLLCILTACQKEIGTEYLTQTTEPAIPEIITYKFPGYNPVINISQSFRKIEAQFPATVLSGDSLIAEFSLSGKSTASVNGVQQVSTITPNDFGKDIFYQVTAPGNPLPNNWHVIATNNEQTYGWGLGHFIQKETSTKRGYEWYYDQGTTGIYSSVNCGPASTTMAIKWADASFTRPPEYARNFYGTNGGWWFTSFIINYLNDNTIPNAIVPLGSSAEETWVRINRQLDQGRVVILCLDMHYINQAATSSAFRVGRFYSASVGFGHFILVKGYKQVDKNRYFEVYDPNSFGAQNPDDQTLQGRGRFYRYDEIYKATSVWWNYAITVNPKGVTIDPSTLRQALDPTTVPVASGR